MELILKVMFFYDFELKFKYFERNVNTKHHRKRS